MKANNTMDNQRQFKNIKTECRRIIRIKNRNKERENFDKNKNDNKKIWRQTKRKMFSNNESNMERIMFEDKLHVGSKSTAEVINKFFRSKVDKLIEKIHKSKIDPMVNFYKSIKTPEKLFQFKEIDSNDMNKIITQLSNSCSAGNDDISNRMIKLVKKSITLY